MNAKRLGILSMVLALSLILAYVDILIPYNFVIPGIKLGLANNAILLLYISLAVRKQFV